jgi:lysophospholipase L1-like esterase
VLLLGIFPRNNLSGHQNAKLKAVNETISKLDDGVWVRYLDIGDKFLEGNSDVPKDVMDDGLHPSTRGYQIWADAMAPLLTDMMK